MDAKLVIALQGLLVLLVLLLLLRCPVHSYISGGLALLGFLVVGSTIPWLSCGTDAHIYWNAGKDVANGLDPYARPAVMNPPTALPFFALFGRAPYPIFLALWTGSLFLGYCLVVPAACQALSAGKTWDRWQLPGLALLVFGSTLILSYTCRFGLFLGQMSVLVVLAICAALWCQGRGRPVWAGLWLALASVKPATMLPFLLLFHRKRDVKSWLALAGFGLALAMVWVPPWDLPATLAECLANIRHGAQPGGVNDYSFASSNNRELIAFDYALYHVGLRERTLVGIGQLAAALLLGVFVAWRLWRRPGLSHAAACSLVACYSAVFLYHRLYDMVILAIPLVYCAGRGISEVGRARWLYRLCTVGILGVLYLRLDLLKSLSEVVQQGGVVNRMLEIVILPYGTWLVVVVLFTLAVAEASLSSKEDGGAEPSAAATKFWNPIFVGDVPPKRWAQADHGTRALDRDSLRPGRLSPSG
jgi:hypothetical protein